jgi:hypothetical protein
MYPSVFERIKKINEDKSKWCLEFRTNGCLYKIGLQPTQGNIGGSNIEKINNEYLIYNWSLNALHEQIFYSYFCCETLQEKVRSINQSIMLVSSLSFVESNQFTESLAITTYLWRETVLKVVVSLSQVTKIEHSQKDGIQEYYLHLSHPPMYYINELKITEASSEKYLKFHDRVTNFIFIENELIEKNYFLKYFLLNNSILTIAINLKRSHPATGGYSSETEAYAKM